MSQQNEKQPMNVQAANALWNLVTLTVSNIRGNVKRHPDVPAKGLIGHDFLGYVSVQLALNTALLQQLKQGANATQLQLLGLIELAFGAFKESFNSLEIKRFRKSGKLNVSSQQYKGGDGEWYSPANPLTAELHAVIQLAVEQSQDFQARLALCNSLPVPVEGRAAVAAPAAATLGAMPFSG